MPNISIDFIALSKFLELGFPRIALLLFFESGWISVLIWLVIIIALRPLAEIAWLNWRQGIFSQNITYTYLAIDIPPNNEQTLRAVEQIYVTLSGAQTSFNLMEKWWEGKYQLAFSLEIISIDGYLQYIVRTPSAFRDLVQSAFFAQYPNCEITEVEDYTTTAPQRFPDEKYNLWGSELVLSRKDIYPIKTYPQFEDMMVSELKDPMAAVLETMNNIKEGEQFWFQIILKPTGFEWVAKALAEAGKLAGKKSASDKKKSNPVSSGLSGVFSFLADWAAYYNTITPGANKVESRTKDEPPSMMMHLTPNEKNAIEAIEKKASKIGFECKIRIMYLAPKEIFSAQRVVSSVMGAIKQFTDSTLNGLKPDNMTKTAAYYGLAERKKNRRRTLIMQNYIGRATWAGRKPFILNTEEIASLYHFPVMTVKTPLQPKIEMKKSEPPSYLPMGDLPFGSEKTSNLREELDILRINNDYYERRYGIKKDRIRPQQLQTEDSKKSDNIPSNLPLA